MGGYLVRYFWIFVFGASRMRRNRRFLIWWMGRGEMGREKMGREKMGREKMGREKMLWEKMGRMGKVIPRL